MKRTLAIIISTIIVIALLWYAFLYVATYSEGYRSGELINFSSKGYVVKTWEGDLSQGANGAQIFRFSVMDSDTEIVRKLTEYQGRYVKVRYKEKYGTFFFWGETTFFITEVFLERSPYLNRN
jgi:hypothetical protein